MVLAAAAREHQRDVSRPRATGIDSVTASVVLVAFGVACCLGVAASLTQRIALARSHRDAGALAARGVALVAVLAVGTSMVAAPDAWASAYDGVMGMIGR